MQRKSGLADLVHAQQRQRQKQAMQAQKKAVPEKEGKGEKMLSKESDLVALTIIFDSKDFFNTPGVIFSAIRKLAWEQINIFEIISTMTELTFILSKKDSMKAYNALQEMVGK